ncbi:MAG TPA: dephospho-CoA kinase [Thermoanaerobaculaceae bacterium]|nr:dephospho-CoA kinase [Thermoanaerobaculaceae bacterium]
MLRVGVTGGVASGKSTLSAALRGLGAEVCDADALVAELYRPNGPGARAVLEVFGTAVIAADGSVDRKALGDLVLADAVRLRRLEAAIHPQVRARVASWYEGLRRRETPPDVAVVEAALLVETGASEEYDRLVVVTAPETARRQRALAAGWRPERLDAVIAAQLTDPERAAAADYVVANERAPGDLAAAAATLWVLLTEDAARLAEGLPLLDRRIELP